MSTQRLSSADARARGYDRDNIVRIELEEKARSAAQVLIGEIEKAFRDIPRPRITLSVARGYYDEWNLSEDRVRCNRFLDRCLLN